MSGSGHLFSKPLPKHVERVATVVIAILVGLIIFAVADGWAPTRARESAKRASCKMNLRQIRIACQIYADDNGGWFPDRLEQLYPIHTDNSAKIFSCPSNPATWADFTRGTVTEKSTSYRLVPGLRADVPGPFILAYDASPQAHGGDGPNVAYTDGSVTWLKMRPGSPEEAAFQRRLAEEAERIRAWKPPVAGAGADR